MLHKQTLENIKHKILIKSKTMFMNIPFHPLEIINVGILDKRRFVLWQLIQTILQFVKLEEKLLCSVSEISDSLVCIFASRSHALNQENIPVY